MLTMGKIYRFLIIAIKTIFVHYGTPLGSKDPFTLMRDIDNSQGKKMEFYGIIQ